MLLFSEDRTRSVGSIINNKLPSSTNFFPFFLMLTFFLGLLTALKTSCLMTSGFPEEFGDNLSSFLFNFLSLQHQFHSIILPPPCWNYGKSELPWCPWSFKHVYTVGKKCFCTLLGKPDSSEGTQEGQLLKVERPVMDDRSSSSHCFWVTTLHIDSLHAQGNNNGGDVEDRKARGSREYKHSNPSLESCSRGYLHSEDWITKCKYWKSNHLCSRVDSVLWHGSTWLLHTAEDTSNSLLSPRIFKNPAETTHQMAYRHPALGYYAF